MMNISTFIAKVDIFELLGLSLNDEEKGNFLEKVARVLSGRIMQYAIDDNAITEADLKAIEALGDKYIAVQEEIMDRVKGIEKYMLDASFDFKVEAFVKQMEDFQNFLISKGKEEISDEELTRVVENMAEIGKIFENDVDADFIVVRELMSEDDGVVGRFKELMRVYGGDKERFGFK